MTDMVTWDLPRMIWKLGSLDVQGEESWAACEYAVHLCERPKTCGKVFC